MAASPRAGWPAGFLEIPVTSPVCAVGEDDGLPTISDPQGKDGFERESEVSQRGKVEEAVEEVGQGEAAAGPANSGTSSARHPLLAALPELPEYIRLLRADALAGLPVPMPRCQDIAPACFGVPGAGDVVLAVSHAWPHQAHPDASGEKVARVLECLGQIGMASRSVFLFFDFLSIPQRPFRLGQPGRSPDDSRRFAGALQRMHWVFFYADRIMHLESPAPHIPEEGTPYQLPGSAMLGASLAEIGGWVQVVGMERRQGSGLSLGYVRSRSCRWGLLDRLCRAGDGEVESLAQVLALMELPDFADCPLDLQRFPFGRPNRVPASERGWVYLERFITMVKCSMLAPEYVDITIVSTAEATLEQVREGADMLRRAAGGDARSRAIGGEAVELGLALEVFTAELRTKAFSSTSIDKALNQVQVQVDASPDPLAAAVVADVDIVIALMHLFVEELKIRWDEFESTQRKRTNMVGKMVDAALGLVLDWQGFSSEYSARLEAAQAGGRARAALVLLGSPVYALSPYLLLRSRPDEGWRQAPDFWCIFFPFQCYMGYWVAPLIVDEMMGYQRSGRGPWLRALAWVALAGTCWQIPVLLSAASTGVFPVPFTNLFGYSVSFPPNLFLLYLLIPRAIRRRHGTRKRLVSAMGVLSLLTLIVVSLYPLSARLFQVSSSAGAQAVVLPLVFGARLAVECVGTVAARLLGADIMPTILFISMYTYQYHLCQISLSIRHWLVFLELGAVDLAVKGYYALELRRLRRGAPMTGSLRSGRSAAQEESAAAQEARMQRIVVLVVLRQSVEVLTSLHFLVMVTAMHYLHPDLFGYTAQTKKQGLLSSIGYILVLLAFDVLCFAVAARLFHAGGYRAAAIQRALAEVHFWLFLICSNTALLLYVSFQVPHFGMDMTFTFPWVHDRGARWQGGLDWDT